MDCLFRVKTITLETANVTNCHVIATHILFLSSNHRSVQFLYLAASQLSQSAILFIGRAPRPQALILLKIAPAARTYGLHLFSEAFLIFLRLFLFPMWWKENSDKINKMHIQGDVFHFPQNA